MITILDNKNIFDHTEKLKIENIAFKAMKALQQAANEVTIVLENDHGLRELNKQFAGHDYATDVLSFSANDLDPETGEHYLGDIVISVDQVDKHAAENEHSFFEELATLIVHGLLHLCGYDHAEETEKKEMFTLQEQILADLKETIS